MTFENSNPTVADVCACLWFAKVVARDLDTSAATDNGERKQKITAVVTTGVVWSQVHLAEIWLQSLECCQRVFNYRHHRKPVLSALIKYMDVGSCLKRILEWLIKKKKIQSGISDAFFSFGFGAVSCPSSNKLAFSYFHIGVVSVHHISSCRNLHWIFLQILFKSYMLTWRKEWL